MKKIISTLFSHVIAIGLFAQQAPPQGINYQAMVYVPYGNQCAGVNSSGQLAANTKQVVVKFTITEGYNGPIKYEETITDTTDQYGLLNTVIGTGAPTSNSPGLFNQIDWSIGNPYLKVKITLTQYNSSVSSNQKLWSVPYALYSGFSNSANYADSSDYATQAGNGIIGVTDNGDGTLTFTYLDGSSYTTGPLTGLGSIGPQGPQGAQGAQGVQGPAGQNGSNGQSAYDIWLTQGNTGTQQDFLNSLQGLQGPTGLNGTNGQSAYDLWLAEGNTGTQQDFLNSLQVSATSGPIFIAPINIINKSGNQVYQNLSILSDINSSMGINVSSVILSVEFNFDFGGSSVGTNIHAEVNAICGNNTFKVIKSKFTDSNYASNSISDRQQLILPVINGQILFTVPTWTTVYGQSLIIDIVGYFN